MKKYNFKNGEKIWDDEWKITKRWTIKKLIPHYTKWYEVQCLKCGFKRKFFEGIGAMAVGECENKHKI